MDRAAVAAASASAAARRRWEATYTNRGRGGGGGVGCILGSCRPGEFSSSLRPRNERGSVHKAARRDTQRDTREGTARKRFSIRNPTISQRNIRSLITRTTRKNYSQLIFANVSRAAYTHRFGKGRGGGVIAILLFVRLGIFVFNCGSVFAALSLSRSQRALARRSATATARDEIALIKPPNAILRHSYL